VLLSESWRYLAVGTHPRYFLGHAWTLFYEEQFYIVAGLMLVLWPRRYFALAAVVTVLTLLARHLAPRLGISLQGSFLDGHWLMFAAGILVYYYVNYATGQGRSVCLALAGAGIAYSAQHLALVWRLPNTFESNALAAFSFAMALMLMHRWDAPVTAAKPLAPARFCGTICYSLYLIHWPICKALSHLWHAGGVRGPWASVVIVIPTCVAASLLAGFVFHRLVERHFLNAPAASTEAVKATRRAEVQPRACHVAP